MSDCVLVKTLHPASKCTMWRSVSIYHVMIHLSGPRQWIGYPSHGFKGPPGTRWQGRSPEICEAWFLSISIVPFYHQFPIFLVSIYHDGTYKFLSFPMMEPHSIMFHHVPFFPNNVLAFRSSFLSPESNPCFQCRTWR